MDNAFSIIEQSNDIKKGKIGLETWLLGIYFLFLPLDFIGTSFGSISKILSLFAIALCFLYNIKYMKIEPLSLIAMTVFWVLTYSSSLYAFHPFYAISRAKTLVLNFLMIIICSSISKNKSEIEFLNKSLVYSGWIVLFLLVTSNKDMMGRITVRFGGTTQDPNYLCGYMFFAIMYYINQMVSDKIKLKTVIYLLLFMIGILSTGSRGGTISVIGMCLFFFMLSLRFKKVSKIILATSVVLIVFFLIYRFFLPDNLLSRFSLEFFQKDRGAGRFDIWRDVINQYKNLPDIKKWFGVGAGTIRYHLLSNNVAHNLWLETLFELGIFGLISIEALYSIFVSRAIKQKDKMYAAVMMGYLTMTISLSLYAYKPIFAMFLMINIVFNSSDNIAENDIMTDNKINGDFA